jgi:hypothetical protein
MVQLRLDNQEVVERRLSLHSKQVYTLINTYVHMMLASPYAATYKICSNGKVYIIVELVTSTFQIFRHPKLPGRPRQLSMTSLTIVTS